MMERLSRPEIVNTKFFARQLTFQYFNFPIKKPTIHQPSFSVEDLVCSAIIQWRIKMRWLWMLASVMIVVTGFASQAYAQTCQQLWVERNQFYKNHGYCFKTQRAIEFFGNGSCFINDEGALALTPAERGRIA